MGKLLKDTKLGFYIRQCIKAALFWLVEKFISGPSAIEEKSLLLIRLDAIGDYILFHNYIDLIHKSVKFSEHKITLLGNKEWRDLELGKQRTNVDEYIWIDRKKFSRNPVYRWRTLRNICSKGYDVILHPTFSREYFVGDNVVKLATSRHKIGNSGDLGNQTAWQKHRSDKYYTKLLKGSNRVLYEFERNRMFFEDALELEIKNHHLPQLPVYLSSKQVVSKAKYIVFFIGANTPQRKWAIRNYARLATLLMKRAKFENHEFIVCGSQNEKDDARDLISGCSISFNNLVGQTSLVELANIISGADLLVTNETSAHHIGVATGCNAMIVIYAGNHFGRFVPLDDHNERYKVVLHPEILISPKEYCKSSNAPGYVSRLNINDISVEIVLDAIDSF